MASSQNRNSQDIGGSGGKTLDVTGRQRALASETSVCIGVVSIIVPAGVTQADP